MSENTSSGDVDTLRYTIAQLEATIRKRDESIAGLNTKRKVLSDRIGERSKALSTVGGLLRERDREIEELQKRIEELGGPQVERLEEQLRGRDETIAAFKDPHECAKQLMDAKNLIQLLENQVASKDRWVLELHQKLADSEAKMKELNETISKLLSAPPTEQAQRKATEDASTNTPERDRIELSLRYQIEMLSESLKLWQDKYADLAHSLHKELAYKRVEIEQLRANIHNQHEQIDRISREKILGALSVETLKRELERREQADNRRYIADM